MSDCSNHKKDLFGETDMKVVAEAICELNYETINELFHNIELKLWVDGSNDEKNGRPKLGKALQTASVCMEDVAEYIRQAWVNSKPFMQEQK